MRRWAQGEYVVRNPAKYVGKNRPRYRSGWELSFMVFLDQNNHILQWASEAISIPYRHPLTGKMTNYVPDFFIRYRDSKNHIHAEIVEIKPKKQSVVESKMSNRERAVVAVNYCKWAAAEQFCKRQGLTFRILTEHDIFRNGKR